LKAVACFLLDVFKIYLPVLLALVYEQDSHLASGLKFRGQL